MSFVVRSGTGTETTAVTPQPQATPIPANLADLEPGGPLPAAPQPVVHNSDTHIALNPTDKDLLKYLQKSKITTRNSVAAWISHYLLFGWWTTRKAEKYLKGQGIDTQKLSWRDTRWLAIQTMAAKEDNGEAVKNLLEDNNPSRQSQVNQALASLLRDKGGLISQAAIEYQGSHEGALPPNFLALFTNEETRNARLDTLLEKAAADPSVLQGLVKLAQDEGIGDAVANHVKELARVNNQSALILWAATAYNDDAGLDGDFAALFAEDAPDRDDRLTTLLSVAHTNPDVHTTVIQLTKNDEIGGHIEEQVIAAADRHEPGAISICCQLVGESSYQQYARNMAELERLLAPPNGPPEEGAAARLTDLSNRTQNQTKLLELARDPAVVEILVQILSSSTAEQRDLQKGAILALAPRLIGGDDERVLSAISRLLASADPEEKVLLFRLAQEIPDLVTVLNKAITKHLQDHPEGREAIQAKLATMLNQQSPVLRGLIARGNALALEVLREAAVHNKPKALTELLAMLTANPPIAAAGPILQAAVQGGSKSALTILTHAASKGSEIALGTLCYLAPTNEEATLDLCEVAKKHPVEVMPKLRQLADQGNAGARAVLVKFQEIEGLIATTKRRDADPAARQAAVATLERYAHIRLNIPLAPTNSVGEFSDINLARAPELLGHGNVNQVFKVTFNTASGPKTKVFKPLSESEVSDFIAAAATRMGIDEFRPNYGGRNVASSRLARLFGLPHVCETNFALIDGQLGILMDFEPGVSPTKEVSPVIGQEHQDHRYLSEYQRITNITDRRLTPDEMAYRTQLQIYLASHGFSEIAKIETQGNALKVTFTQAVAINYDPRVCLDLLEGHFLDFICAQGDRNPGNILIRQGERNGAVFIDNDISFGDRITCADDLRDNPPYYFGELPAIATQQIKDNIGQVTDEQIREQLQDLFAPELAERTITATIARVNYLRQALGLPTTAPLPPTQTAPTTPALGMVRPRSPAPLQPIEFVDPEALLGRLAPPPVPPLDPPAPPQAQSRPTTPTSRPQTPSPTPPPRPRTPPSRPRTPVAPQIPNNYVTRYLYRLDQARTAGNLMPYPATVAGRT